mgnify:CR=1 FL=1
MKHPPVGVVAAAFIVLYQEKGNAFTNGLARKIHGSPGLGLLIGGVINFLAMRGMLPAQAGVGAVTGEFPNCRPSSGFSTQTAADSVRFSIQQLNMAANLQAAMNCVVGIQNDLLMLGFDKIIGAADGTFQATYGAYKTARGVQDKYNVVDPKARLEEFKDALKSNRAAPEDVFIALI